MTEFKAHFKSVQPDLGGSLPGRLIFGIPGKDGGYYLVAAEQVDANTIRFTFTPSQEEMPKVDPVEVDLPGATDEQIQKIIEEYLQNNPAIGQPGKDGFSPIAKVTQTADGAVVTITDKDDTTEVFIANGRNGYTPQKGIDYDDGKSAYEYAKDGGYTGTEAEFAAKLAEEYPDVPEWAMKESKPSYSKSEVGLGSVDNVLQYSASNPPPYPVASVNGQTGKVQLGAADVGARPSNWMPTAQEVGALPDTYVPPDQTAAQVGADPAGTAAAAVSAHNTSTDSHGDLRLALKAINDRLTAFFDSDNQTLDELSEIVAYITSNKALIDSITTSKVSVGDIVNNLTTNVANKPLSAAQGVALKGLIDVVSNSLSNYQPKGDYALASAIPTKVSQLQNDKGYLTEHQDISGKLDADKLPEAVNTALAQAKASGEFDGAPGAPGVTPHIGTNGNWYIGTTDTGVKAQGKDGSDASVTATNITSALGYTPAKQSDVEQKANKQGLSLGVGGDGLVYLFVDGTAQGNGLDIKAEAVAGDVVGYVDENNTIILTGALADGTYTFKYEDDEGKTTDIGSIKLGGSSYTNQLDEAGYQTGHRLSSSGEPSAVAGTNPTFITGYIRVSDQQTVRLKNCFIDVDGINGFNSTDTTAYYGKAVNSLYITFCNSSQGILNSVYWHNFDTSPYVTDVVKDSNGHVTQFKINRSGIAYIRLTLGGDAPNAILTLDQEITD